MKRLYLLLIVLCALLVAVPASAAKPEMLGEQINIFTHTPDEYPAGEPFHIVHGWEGLPLGEIQPGKFDFKLYVDGEFVNEDFVEREVSQSDEGPLLLMLWVHNFPGGLETGSHTFDGYWYSSCGYAVEMGYIDGPCEKVNKTILVKFDTHTVLFIEP